MSADDLKDQGNAAFRAGDFHRAMDLYTQAVALDRSNSVCFHNRAVCKLKLADYAGAVADAEEAISWNQAYVKAYSTKGSALLHLSRNAEAVDTFKRGLELEPGNATLQSNLRHAEAAVARAEARAAGAAGAGTDGAASNSSGSGGSRPSSSAGGASNAPPSSSSSSSTRRTAPSSAPAPAPSAAAASGGPGVMLWGVPFPPGRAAQVIVMARVALLALFITYMLPLGFVSVKAYNYLLLLAAVTHCADIIARFGRPSPSADYVSRIAWDPFFHLMFLPLAFLAAPQPNTLAALISIDFDVLHALEWLHAAANVKAPAAARRMEGAANAVLPYVAGRPASELARMSIAARWSAVNSALFSHNAMVEIIVTFFLVLRLLSPSRAVLTTLAMVQLLQFRFMASEHTRAAFAQIDGVTTAVTSHPQCPAVVGTGYGKLRAFLRSRVRTQEEMQAAAAAGQRPQGPAACAIM